MLACALPGIGALAKATGLARGNLGEGGNKADKSYHPRGWIQVVGLKRS